MRWAAVSARGAVTLGDLRGKLTMASLGMLLTRR
jgi:hypothetical protein